MRLLEHFDEAWFAAAQQRNARLHLWVPPVPGDPGVPIGAAWLLAQMAGAPRGAPMTHAFYCGTPPLAADIAAALNADDVASQRIGEVTTTEGREAIADLMAFMVAQNGVIALYQGAGGDRPARARPSLDPGQSLQPRCTAGVERARQIPRGHPPAGADGDARSGAAIFRAGAGRVRRRLQRLQLHGADGAFEAGRAREDPRRDSCRRHRPHPDRARGSRSPHLRLSEGARPPHRRRDVGEYLFQCRGSDRADAAAGDRHAAPLQGPRRRGAGRRRRHGHAAWHGGERDSGRFSGWYAAWKAGGR